MLMHTGCAILAGGEGSRLGGTPKGLIELGGETLAERLIRLAAPLCSEIMLITNTPSLYASMGVPIHPDDTPGRGPLEGIATALRHSRSERILVMACDMPLISHTAMETLVAWQSSAEVVAPRSAKGLEPLFALYTQSALPAIEEYLSSGGRKIISAFKGLEVESLSEEIFDPQIWYNINEAIHLDELARITGQIPSLHHEVLKKQHTG